MEARVGRINAVLSGAVNVATAAAADSGCEGEHHLWTAP